MSISLSEAHRRLLDTSRNKRVFDEHEADDHESDEEIDSNKEDETAAALLLRVLGTLRESSSGLHKLSKAEHADEAVRLAEALFELRDNSAGGLRMLDARAEVTMRAALDQSEWSRGWSEWRAARQDAASG